ncbi:tryptophan 7-halogenase [Pseudonocardia spinosispora]|uniref:tryptophan 7-halogenase n=1 Tax=Pseudonocardia spinosispora TaxID=103441 RepID=UPI0003F89D15|nr:tryptophan 7-halogenase [Pseudonocardia spinosispora]
MSSATYDVIVVGGGPAGSTVSTLVAKRGHQVLLLEKERFPRYQIGESLLPSTVHGVARLLGVEKEIEQAGFTVKHGGTFRWGADPEPWTFDFAVSSRMAGPTSHAYQVERAKFDTILLDNAARSGVEVRQECSVLDVLRDGDRITGVRYRDVDGVEHEATAGYVVDSSGNTGNLHRHVGGNRAYSEFFRNLALFGYWENGKRLPAPSEGNILCVAFDAGWFWYIPLSPTLTSVGAVVNRESAALVQGDPERAMSELIQACPLIRDNLADATRVTDGMYGQLRVRKDWSYCATTFSAPGMVLVGDAACFVDPVFSSGVHLATYGATLAARSLNASLAGEVEEKEAFAEFEQRYRREYALFYEFLVGFYNLHQSQDSYFWEARKIANTAPTDLESFINLVGGVAGDEFTGPRFTETAGELADTFTSGGRAHAGGGFLGTLLAAGAELQVGAVLGDHSAMAAPAGDGGLTVSPDGLSWVRS